MQKWFSFVLCLAPSVGKGGLYQIIGLVQTVFSSSAACAVLALEYDFANPFTYDTH